MAEESQQKKTMLLGVVLLGGLGYLGYTQLYQPRAERVDAMESRLETLQTQNRTARALTEQDGRGEVEQRLAVYRDQLVHVEGLIPSSEEVPDLLDAISAEAQRTGVDLTLIQPTGAIQEDFYVRRTYDLAVMGTYHQIAEFLTRTASLPRIVTPINLNLGVEEETPDAAPRLQARFAIETYVIPSLAPPSDTTHAD